MRLLNRRDELARLEGLARSRDGGLAVVWGRRRLGKTRLLVEWAKRAGGVYTVADQSTAEVQRRYFAEAVAERLPGFADVTYPDWARLFDRLARDAKAQRFRGPIVIDELPYLAASSPELASVLQRWIDHSANDARLVVALAGSSQRMMQGLVLDAGAPLFGRAKVALKITPLPAQYLVDAFGTLGSVEAVHTWAAWGGVPRYWELAAPLRVAVDKQLDALVLDPNGPLHSEADRVLLEEVPTAAEVRPILDAIGAGAHRVSEIAGRLGRAATSLSRPLDRLVGMDLVRREVPYGDPPRSGKRSIYRIDDPFFRLWFRVVAPHRAALVAGTTASRATVLSRHWDTLAGLAWEDLCRAQLPRFAALGDFAPPQRWWSGNAPEWDLIADAVDGRSTLVGESRFVRRALGARELAAEARRLAARPLPAPLADRDPGTIVRALFVPATAPRTPRRFGDVSIVTCEDLLGRKVGARARS